MFEILPLIAVSLPLLLSGISWMVWGSPVRWLFLFGVGGAWCLLFWLQPVAALTEKAIPAKKVY